MLTNRFLIFIRQIWKPLLNNLAHLELSNLLRNNLFIKESSFENSFVLQKWSDNLVEVLSAYTLCFN